MSSRSVGGDPGVLGRRLTAALGLRSVVSTLLFGVTPVDPVSYVLAAAAFAVVALAMAAIPAHRASRVDPTSALRYE